MHHLKRLAKAESHLTELLDLLYTDTELASIHLLRANVRKELAQQVVEDKNRMKLLADACADFTSWFDVSQ